MLALQRVKHFQSISSFNAFPTFRDLISSELSGGMCVVLPITVGNEVAVSIPQTSDLEPANVIKLITGCLFPCTVTFSRGTVTLCKGRVEENE